MNEKKSAMNTEDNGTETAEPRQSRLLLRVLGIGLILISVIIAIYLIVGYFAYQSGQEIRVEAVESQRAQQLTNQIELAQGDISVGSYDLALRRLDWVLERYPDNVEALALQQQAEAALKTALTPDAPPTATPLPEPIPDLITDLDDPQATLASLQRMAELEQWQDLITAVISFQRQFPSYERLETDRLLYAASLNLGLQLIKGENIESGLYYLAQAEKLGDLPKRHWIIGYGQNCIYKDWLIMALIGGLPVPTSVICVWLHRFTREPVISYSHLYGLMPTNLRLLKIGVPLLTFTVKHDNMAALLN